MELQLIDGFYSTTDTIDILSQMVQVKIKYHESKIHPMSNTEDIKYRESRIKKLQEELQKVKEAVAEKGSRTTIKSSVLIN